MALDLAAARANMVESQVRTCDVTNPALLEAMRRAPRERLLGEGEAYRAYADVEIRVEPGRWLLRPRDIGKLLQALDPRPGERALALAAPYGAMVLEEMRLKVRAADPEGFAVGEGQYDVIVCEGAVARVPAAWIAGLAEGGRLGAVEREGPVGRARLWLRADGVVGMRTIFDCSAPVMAGFEPPTVFSF